MAPAGVIATRSGKVIVKTARITAATMKPMRWRDQTLQAIARTGNLIASCLPARAWARANTSHKDFVERRRMFLDDPRADPGRLALKGFERAPAGCRPFAARAFPPRRARGTLAATPAARQTGASAGDEKP